MNEEAKISESEWIVMDALWTLGEATPSEVIAQLAGSTDWNHRTIRTLLRRLVEKRFVQRIKRAKGGVYRATVSRSDCIHREGRTFLDRVFGGDAHSLLLHFAREAPLSRDKLQQLLELLEDESQE